MRSFIMNFTKSATSIDVLGNILINGTLMDISGTFGSFFKSLTVQSQNVILHEIFGRNFTNVEINAKFETEVFIKGFIILLDDVQMKLQCDMELRRISSKYFTVNQCVIAGYKSTLSQPSWRASFSAMPIWWLPRS